MADGFEQLGAALGGGDPSELAFQQGLNLGARTQGALATARKRVSENAAREKLGESFKAVGIDPSFADIALSGINLRDITGGMQAQQEIGFRGIAGAPDSTIAERNAALAGVASGPVAPFKAVGSRGFQNIFDPDAGVMPLGDALSSGGGDSAQIQLLRAMGLLNDQGRVTDQARAISTLRNTQQVTDVGGVPTVVNVNNPFTPATPTPVAPVNQVASNVGTIAEAKDLSEARAKALTVLPQAASRFRNQTAQSERVLNSLSAAIGETSAFTAGPAGKVLGFVPGTPAFNLKSRIDTIRASVGFKGLQDMRYESPTGGALGQVAVQELTFLQAVLGNLDTAQSPSQLIDMMQQVQDAYLKFKKFARDDFNAARLTAAGDFKGAADLVADSTEGFEPPDLLSLPGNPDAETTAPPAGERKTIGGRTFVKVNGQWFEDDGT